MIKRLIPLLFFFYTISAQIALPTFQAVHKPHNTTSSICGGTPETPWGSNYGVSGTGYSWNHMMGYVFTPLVDGCITKFGGYFDGDKTVRLWKISSEELLAKVTVPDPNNSWVYVDISSVSISSGEQYYVAVYVNGGGAYKSGVGLPKTYGNITINYNRWAYGYNSDTYPTSFGSGNQTNWLHGMVDITFVPDE